MKGRFLSYRDLIAMGRWPVSGCLDFVPTVKVGSWFFISHPWLSTTHPDPEGLKFGLLREWFHRLERLLVECDSIDPAAFTRDDQKAWIDRRFGRTPISTKEDFNAIPNRLFGWEWAAEDGLTGQTERAATEFLGWLRSTITRVLDGHLWIDSHAGAPAWHRRACARCRSEHRAILDSIPELVAGSTCVLLNSIVSKDQSRGWLQLESSIASHNAALIQGMPNAGLWDMDAIRGRLARQDYRCTDEDDAVALPRIYALERTRAWLQETRASGFFRDSSLQDEILDHFARCLSASDPSDPERGLAALVELLRDPDLHELVRVVSLAVGGGALQGGGRFLNLSSAYVAACVLRSAARRLGWPVSDRPDPQVVAQACVYVAVCRRRMSVAATAASICAAWRAMCVPGDPTAAEPALLDEVRSLVEFWLREDEPTIEISLDEYRAPAVGDRAWPWSRR